MRKPSNPRHHAKRRWDGGRSGQALKRAGTTEVTGIRRAAGRDDPPYVPDGAGVEWGGGGKPCASRRTHAITRSGVGTGAWDRQRSCYRLVAVEGARRQSVFTVRAPACPAEQGPESGARIHPDQGQVAAAHADVGEMRRHRCVATLRLHRVDPTRHSRIIRHFPVPILRPCSRSCLPSPCPSPRC